MSKQNTIITILIVVLLIIGGLTFWYFSNNVQKTTTPVTTDTTNPFGNTSVDKTTPVNNQPTTVPGQTTTPVKNLAKLIQLYRNPTSGSVFLINKNNQNIVRFVDRAVGNTYEYLPENQDGQPIRLTNTTIPKIQEAVWSDIGDSVVLRYLENDTDNISSFSAKIKVSSSSNVSGEITGLFLASNLKQLVINPASDKIFAIVDKSDKSGTYGFTTNLDGGNKKVIFDSPISYWNIAWPKNNIIAFTTKPNYRDPGLLFFFNTQTYSMDRVLGGVIGMSTLVNKEANLVAYSYTANNAFYLDVYDVINKIDKNIRITTLADKCVWGENNPKILYCAIPKAIVADNYPDIWYQGLRSFSDNIWKIDTDTGAITQIYEIGSNENVDIDAVDLKISLNDEYLAFINKFDLSLWLLQIK